MPMLFALPGGRSRRAPAAGIAGAAVVALHAMLLAFGPAPIARMAGHTPLAVHSITPQQWRAFIAIHLQISRWHYAVADPAPGGADPARPQLLTPLSIDYEALFNSYRIAIAMPPLAPGLAGVPCPIAEIVAPPAADDLTSACDTAHPPPRPNSA